MRRQYAGAAYASVLTSDLAASAAALVISCNDLTNWPDGTVGPFYVVVDRGLPNEEKILCSTRSGNTLNVYDDGITSGRGADGTSVSSHNTNAVIEHVFTATDADEANLHVNSTSGVHGVSGNVVGTSGTQTLTGKTMTSPVLNTPSINGGTITNATISGSTFSGGITASSVQITGAQALNSFRARNVYGSTSEPTSGDGSDGDMWVVYS